MELKLWILSGVSFALSSLNRTFYGIETINDDMPECPILLS